MQSGHRRFYLEPIPLAIGLGAGLAVWFLAVVGGWCWVTLKGPGTYRVDVYVYLAGIAGVMLGGLFAGGCAGKKGWLQGAVAGFLLGIVNLLANLEFYPQAYSWMAVGRFFLLWSLWGLLGGGLGDMISGKGKEKEKGRMPL